MKIIIGKFLVCSFVFFAASIHAQTVSLSVRALDGGTLEQAGVGKPFMVEVSVDSASMMHEQPVWNDMPGVMLHNNGYQLKMINGVAQATYQFRARIDQEGTFTVGPVTVAGSSSNTITVTVADQERSRGGRAQKKQDSQHFLRLSVSPEKAVVGQRLKGTLRFYAASPGNVSLIEPDRNECSSVTLSALTGPITGNETIDGTNYQYAQWTFDVHAKKAGTCVIPAFAAEYTAHMATFSLFNPFGFMGTGSKKVYSNGARITVVDMPAHAQNISVIGTITHFDASLDHTQAHVGDGLILQVSIVGDLDWNVIKAPALAGMPAEISWYESKQSLEPDPANPAHHRKIFEYIVQPKRPGTFTIPALSMHYFDIDQHAVRTKKTKPITFIALGSASPGAQQTAGAEQDYAAIAPATSSSDNQLLPDVIRTINADRAMPMIPLPWFFFITIIFLIFFSMNGLYMFWNSYRRTMHNARSRIFARAQKQIKQAQKNNDLAALYTIFVQLFSSYLGSAENQTSQQTIQAVLIEKKVPESVIIQWNTFFEQLAEYTYFTGHRDSLPTALIWDTALGWLAFFKETL